MDAVPRPPVAGDGVLPRLVRWMQAHDAPYNCFPSIHVASSYLLLRAYAACRNVGAAAQTAAAAFSLTIIASTFFLKQHVFMDAVGAVIAVEAAQFAVRSATTVWKGVLSPYGARNHPARR
ncbi:hypothetical protein [Gordoniibacillus kamchatkensis]|uniref:hypothetical protein n=1 Tax=Gordoniibacillus kamchatkensis TaxID=1590651 RepID=UPI000696751F|nr:hypothetical protein [Paenibacillus sp. VKM B-2647]